MWHGNVRYHQRASYCSFSFECFLYQSTLKASSAADPSRDTPYRSSKRLYPARLGRWAPPQAGARPIILSPAAEAPRRPATTHQEAQAAEEALSSWAA